MKILNWADAQKYRRICEYNIVRMDGKPCFLLTLNDEVGTKVLIPNRDLPEFLPDKSLVKAFFFGAGIVIVLLLPHFVDLWLKHLVK